MVKLLKNNNKHIDFKKIEIEIEENMKKRKKLFTGYNKEIENIKPYDEEKNLNKENVIKNLILDCNIKMSRDITSHRPIIGSTLVKVRQILYDEIKRSLDPVIDKQTEINEKIVNHLTNLQKQVEELESELMRLNLKANRPPIKK